jgi:hypothetical protein
MSAEREMYERIFMAEERRPKAPQRKIKATWPIPLHAKKRRQLLRWARVELTKPAHTFEQRQTQAAAKFLVQRYAPFEGKRSLKKPVARSR